MESLQFDECDGMSKQAELLLCKKIDSGCLPPRTTCIFTTNHPERLPERFQGRCQTYYFADAEPNALEDLCRRTWQAEGREGDPPGLASLGMPMMGSVESMHANYRLAFQQLEQLLRE
jgi:DNA polymerase III gamma/tau subunit